MKFLGVPWGLRLRRTERERAALALGPRTGLLPRLLSHPHDRPVPFSLNPGLLGMPPNGSKIRRGEAPQVGVACEILRSIGNSPLHFLTAYTPTSRLQVILGPAFLRVASQIGLAATRPCLCALLQRRGGKVDLRGGSNFATEIKVPAQSQKARFQGRMTQPTNRDPRHRVI